MTKKTTVKILIMAAATSLGLAAPSFAQGTAGPDANHTTTQRSSRSGLLGERYTGVAYGYGHVHNSVLDDLNGFGLRYNQPLNPGFDFSVGYDWARSNKVAGIRARAETFTASVTTFTDYKGMRPFIEPGVGWTRAKAGPGKTDSFLYYVGAGAEFQVTAPWVITPYMQFVDVTEYSGTTWNFGVKSAYRLNQNWALTVDLSVDDDRNTGTALGVNYHF